MNYSECIERLIQKKNLSEKGSNELLNRIFNGACSPAQIGAALVALRAKGETADEISGFAKAMRSAMVQVPSRHTLIADTCGTGGDGKMTFNVSTASAFVVAGAGIAVAKHGNRSVSSRSGSADVLEALGVKVDMSQETARKCLDEIGITFLFAPLYHPAMKTVGPVRKDLGVRTIFNVLGPLSNPAGANVQVIGVPNKEYVPLIAQVLAKLSNGRPQCALVLHENGYDELVLSGNCRISQVKNGKVKNFLLTPAKLGFKKAQEKTLRGGNAQENAQILRSVLQHTGVPLADVVIANAALCVYCVQLLKGKADWKTAVNAARNSLQSGAALKKLDQLIQGSQSHG